MLLSYKELVHIVNDQVISGAELENINGTSIDVRIGPKLLIEQRTDPSDPPVDFAAKEPLTMTDFVMDDNGYILEPGEAVLAETMEMFYLPNDITAEFRLKSSGARCFLEHLHAAWCDPCWHGSKLTMELVNMSRFHRLLLRPGTKIGQMTFIRHEPVPDAVSYDKRGQYNNQTEVTQSKGVK